MQVDSIIPNALYSQAFDRYAYVVNNPLKYIDPSGYYSAGQQLYSTDQCGPDGIDCPMNLIDPNNTIGNEMEYNELVEMGYFPMIYADDIPNPEGRSKEIIQKTIDQYLIIRKELFILYGWRYIDKNGKINDQVIIAMIITGEFSGVGAVNYEKAKEALSNQYYSTSTTANIQCNQNCTLTEQMMWLSDIEAWYGGLIYSTDSFNKNNWGRYYDDAVDVSNGYCFTEYCNAWMWGDVTKEQYANWPHPIIGQEKSKYEGKNYWIVWVLSVSYVRP